MLREIAGGVGPSGVAAVGAGIGCHERPFTNGASWRGGRTTETARGQGCGLRSGAAFRIHLVPAGRARARASVTSCGPLSWLGPRNRSADVPPTPPLPANRTEQCVAEPPQGPLAGLLV